LVQTSATTGAMLIALQRTRPYERDHPQEAPCHHHAEPSRSRRESIPGDEDQRGEGVFGQEQLSWGAHVRFGTRVGLISAFSVALVDMALWHLCSGLSSTLHYYILYAYGPAGFLVQAAWTTTVQIQVAEHAVIRLVRRTGRQSPLKSA